MRKLIPEACLGARKLSRSLHSATRALKCKQRGLNWIQTQLLSDGLRSTLRFLGCVLEAAASVGKAGRTYIPRTGDWGQCPPLLESISQVSKGSPPLDDLLWMATPPNTTGQLWFGDTSTPSRERAVCGDSAMLFND